MYLSELFIENFRIFGGEEQGLHLSLRLHGGLNVLVGENDSGKSAVIDAIRFALWTTSQDYYRLTEDDFYISGRERARTLTIHCVFRDLSREEAARHLEWLSVEGGKPCLHLTLKATRLDRTAAVANRGRSIAVTVRSGKKGDGPAFEGEIREFLRATYLRPLRDAEAELAARRGSRLAQILEAHPDVKTQEFSDFDEDQPEAQPNTLVGIMRQAEHRIRANAFIEQARDDLNKEYLGKLSIGDDLLQGEIGVARQMELRGILEKLELWLSPGQGVDLRTRRGLGLNNVLFMATELLLLGGGQQAALPLLLIEEPEVHLHPQMQLRLMEFLGERAANHGVQVLLTTHSPNLASVAELKSIILMSKGQAFPLGPEYTRLDESDYRFLERFLDVTKANLFFAKGVMIVEGDAENILLPTLAKLMGRSFSERGVSVVNVGSRGLFRYSRIFQRTDGKNIPVRVARLVDRDIPPTEADCGDRRKQSDYTPAEIEEYVRVLQADDAEPVQTFVSPKWTLEHDLCCGRQGYGSHSMAFSVHVATQQAKAAATKRKNGQPDFLTVEERANVARAAAQTYRQWTATGLTLEQIALRVYEPLLRGQASKAVAAQFLSERLERTLNIAERLGHNRSLAQWLRSRLPSYIVDAIDFVSAQD